jgi:hypothetical protein
LPLCRYSLDYLLCSAVRLASIPSPAATGQRRRGQRPGHGDLLPAMHNERRRGQRPGHRDQAPATHNERCRGQWPEHLNQVRNGLGTSIKYLRRTTSGAEGNGLRAAIKYLRRTTSGAAGNVLGRCRGLLMCSFTTSAPYSP